MIFGPGDLAASLGIPQREIGAIDPDYPGDQWHYARSRIAVAAHGNGIDPVDGPFAAFRDLEGLAETARRARLLGFVGKWVIHPGQIEACNRAFSPSAAEIAAARRLIGALDDAARDGRAALELDGAMIDEASRRLARGGARPRVRSRAVTDAPLHDIRIVAVEQFGAGPWGTLQLADLGAEVIKIEDPSVGGDVGRYVPPFQEGDRLALLRDVQPQQASVALDLRSPEGRAVFEDLVRRSDAVFSNLRGDQPASSGCATRISRT